MIIIFIIAIFIIIKYNTRTQDTVLSDNIIAILRQMKDV